MKIIEELINNPAGIGREEKLQLLQALLNDLHQNGLVSRATLITLAADVMLLDYQEDEELLCFNCTEHEMHEL